MDHKHDTQRSLTARLATLGAAARSALTRYPQDLAASVRAVQLPGHSPRQPAPIPLRELWNALPEQPGRVSAVAWLGHCSVLLKVGGTTILTDPVFSHRIGVKLGPLTVGPSRHGTLPPGPDELPTADLILLSHAHFDHLDRPTLRRLIAQNTHIVTARGTRQLVPRGFGSVSELDWDRTLDFRGMTLHSIRPAHWGARTAWDRHRGFNSYIINSSEATPVSDRVLFAGDTAETNAFDGLGPFALGIFGIGAYQPWIDAHANPEQAYAMAARAGVQNLLPVHHSTFRLSDEPMHEPLERLLAAAGRAETAALTPSVEPNQTAAPPPVNTSAKQRPTIIPLRVGELHLR